MRFSDKIAVVTGASRGIGREIAEQLAAEGATVGLVARSADALREIEEMIRSKGGRAAVFCADLRDPAKVEALADDVLARWGAVDILVNNAIALTGIDPGLLR